jgi:crossover junction endodeoxyribonuclease RuvC
VPTVTLQAPLLVADTRTSRLPQLAFLGVDPGVSGAVAVLWPDGSVEVHDAPTALTGKGATRRPNIPGTLGLVAQLVSSARERRCFLVGAVELVHAMPVGKGGSISNFSLGFSLGVWESALAFNGIKYDHAPPTAWKKAIGCPTDKNASRLRALQLFPQAGDRLALKKDVGRAEALMIAEWRRRRG